MIQGAGSAHFLQKPPPALFVPEHLRAEHFQGDHPVIIEFFTSSEWRPVSTTAPRKGAGAAIATIFGGPLERD